MTAEAPDQRILTARLDAMLQRLENLEIQVRGLVTSQAIEGREFLLRDERGEIRARLEIADYAPRLTFYDRLGAARLCLGLQRDGSPDLAGFRGREEPKRGASGGPEDSA